ncbi:MAG: GYD domain-containing protein [Candidatus Firestonebacteria bacterium]
MKFLMLGKYSLDAVQKISTDRTEKVVSLIEKAGGKVNLMYVLLGSYDLVFLVDLPNIQKVIKASIAITKLTGISFTTFPAIDVEEFDKIAIL